MLKLYTELMVKVAHGDPCTSAFLQKPALDVRVDKLLGFQKATWMHLFPHEDRIWILHKTQKLQFLPCAWKHFHFQVTSVSQQHEAAHQIQARFIV